MRCALYARYSSDQQRAASIEDQLRLCQARAAREGWSVVEAYTDAALSGATLLRPGYQALLAAMRAGLVELVLAESLDRFSRDQEHIAAFYKQASFAGVRVLTLAEGEVSELHIGLKGTMGALYLKDLADKTRRGLEGRVRAGRGTGAVPYGYTVVRRLGLDGEPERGLRAIDPAQAAVVQRIFRAYAAGSSPLAIARALNQDGIAGPAGGLWYQATIRGRPGRGDGLLRNALYAGLQVWNRRRTVKDPASGQLLRRMNGAEQVVRQAVPELRIVDPELWEAVQTRLLAEAAPPVTKETVAQGPGTGGQRHRFWDQRRPSYLLTGKVFCRACNGQFVGTGQDYLVCAAAKHGACANRRTVRRSRLEAQVYEVLGRQMMDPELVAEFITAFTGEWNRLVAEQGGAAEAGRRELAAVERKLANLLDALSDGVRAPGLQGRLDALEAQRVTLQQRLAGARPAPPALHPNLAQIYRARVADLRRAVAEGDAPDALEAARALLDRVLVGPAPDGGPPTIEVVGDLAAMLRAGQPGHPPPCRDTLGQDVCARIACSLKAAPGGQRPPRGRSAALMPVWLDMLLLFGALSPLAVGGANVLVPELHRQLVENRALLDEATFAQLVALAQAAPGPNILTGPVMGYWIGGVPGLLGAAVGLIGPAAVLAWCVAGLTRRLAGSWWLRPAQAGLVPVAVGLILASGVLIAQGARIPFAWALAGVTALVVWRGPWNPLWVLLAGAVVGLVLG